MIEEIEIWKDVPNYEGLYQVSSFGRVKSFKYGMEKVLKCSINAGGYVHVCLHNKGLKYNTRVHVLVAMAFHGHKPDGTMKIVVDHKDNNKLNNRADNLRLTTNRENCSKDKKNKTSKYTGVVFIELNNKWRASIGFNNDVIYLGQFDLEIDAKKAYDKALEEWKQGLDLRILYPKWKHKTSKYTGVFWVKRAMKWISVIRFKDKRIELGLFELEIDACNAYKKAKKEADEGLDLNELYPKWRNKTSKYKGVSWDTRRGKWRARYKGKDLGFFKTEIEAHEEIKKYIAKLNLIV